MDSRNSLRSGGLVLAAILLLPLSAAAQSWDTASAGQVSRAAQGSPMLQPIGQINLPVEVASLQSHAGFQFGFTSAGYGPVDVNVVSLALEAQAALWDRLEVGLNVPVLIHGWLGGTGQVSGNDTAFGNLQVNLKGKLVGDSRGPYAVSIYANTTLPTTSADLPERGFAMLHTGVAATGQLGIATFGGATGVWTLLNGTDSLAGGRNLVLYNLDFFGGVRLHPMVALQLASQIGIPIEPSGGEVAFTLTPALQVYPLEQLHFDIGSRIAVTDAGEAYTGGGRASLVMAAAYTF